MSSNEELFSSLKEFIVQQNNTQTEKLTNYINTRFSEVEEVIKSQAEKNKELEKELQHIKTKNNILQKQLKINNIIVFNLGHVEGDLLAYTINKLNEVLKLSTALNECDIDNIYKIGKSHDNNPIIIHFVRYLTKQKVLRNCKNLKGIDIKISEVLSQEEREEKKILVRHLKEAKAKNLKAHINGNRLYIESKQYTAVELEKGSSETEEYSKTNKAVEEFLTKNGENESAMNDHNCGERSDVRKKKVARPTRLQKQTTK